MATCHFSSALPRADHPHPESSRQVLLPVGPQAGHTLCSGPAGRTGGRGGGVSTDVVLLAERLGSPRP